jgi:soluble lytic murein transglycosylase-like protein
LNNVNGEALTTYAGLIVRDLLDRFGGDVDQAIGAYNGGARNPNPAYAAGVKNVALYARRVLEHAPASAQTASPNSPRSAVL